MRKLESVSREEITERVESLFDDEKIAAALRQWDAWVAMIRGQIDRIGEFGDPAQGKRSAEAVGRWQAGNVLEGPTDLWLRGVLGALIKDIEERSPKHVCLVRDVRPNLEVTMIAAGTICKVLRDEGNHLVVQPAGVEWSTAVGKWDYTRKHQAVITPAGLFINQAKAWLVSDGEPNWSGVQYWSGGWLVDGIGVAKLGVVLERWECRKRLYWNANNERVAAGQTWEQYYKGDACYD